MRFAYVNSAFVSDESEALPVADRGFLFGDGVFTTIRVSEGVVEAFDRHVERLKKDSAAIGIACPIIDEKVVRHLLHLNRAQKGVWRLKIIISGGVGGDLNLQRTGEAQLIITLNPLQEISTAPLKIGVYPEPIYSLHARIKSLSYLDRLWLREKARQLGLDDYLTVDGQGYLLEASCSNIFWVDRGVLYTPDPALPLLFGIKIQQVIEAAEKSGLKTQFVRILPVELTACTALFLCNSLRGIQAVKTLQGLLESPIHLSINDAGEILSNVFQGIE